MKNTILVLSSLCFIAFGCAEKKDVTLSGLLKEDFSKEINGKQNDLYILKNKNGLEVTVTNYGGRIVSLMVPDKNGELADIVLGKQTIDGYFSSGAAYLGSVIGRYANRIGNARFVLDSVEYKLAANNNIHSLHGGSAGFNARVWDAVQVNPQSIELEYLSPDGEEGYPGNLKIKMVYTLTDKNELIITYEATTDKPTILNLTNHSFFNLEGDGSQSINQHLLTINACFYTPTDSLLLPTGEIAKVENTVFDFQTPTAIGLRIDAPDPQLLNAKGYDLNYVLNKEKPGELSFAAQLEDPVSGRIMEVFTTEPGLQLYTGNFLTGETGKSGRINPFRSGVCLETQNFPDSPNKPHFPSPVLRPGEIYRHTCIYAFSVYE
jgi:aldose 1-epimerase